MIPDLMQKNTTISPHIMDHKRKFLPQHFAAGYLGVKFRLSDVMHTFPSSRSAPPRRVFFLSDGMLLTLLCYVLIKIKVWTKYLPEIG